MTAQQDSAVSSSSGLSTDQYQQLVGRVGSVHGTPSETPASRSHSSPFHELHMSLRSPLKSTDTENIQLLILNIWPVLICISNNEA